MNCGYVKTAWFPLSYVIIVIIIYSFTMFHYCSYYGRYSCYHFDYYCYIYIYIRAHHCYTSWLFSWFSAHFHLNSTAGGTFFRPGQVAGWNRGGKPHWWMVNGWWVHFESGDGWWMVGEWLVNGWWMDPLKLGNHLPGHLPDMSGHASGCLLWVHPHILPGPSKHRDFPIDQSQTEIGNAVFLIKLAVRICTLQYCHTCFFFHVFSCGQDKSLVGIPEQKEAWMTGCFGTNDYTLR